jgi:hypothetical protein
MLLGGPGAFSDAEAMARKMAGTPLGYQDILNEIDPILKPYMQKQADQEAYGRKKIGAEMSRGGAFYSSPHMDLQGRLAAETNTAMSQAIAQMAQGERQIRSGESQFGQKQLAGLPLLRAQTGQTMMSADPVQMARNQAMDAAYRGASLYGQSRGNIMGAAQGGLNAANQASQQASQLPVNVMLLNQLLGGGQR